MIPRVLIDAVPASGDRKELSLYKHDKDFYILLGNEDLMNSRMHESEDALARLAAQKIQKQRQPHVLIGGLGMGYTLRAALDNLPEDARITVAELIPAVVKWNRGPLGELTGNPLNDERANVCESDASIIIKKGRANYNAILLDVDNGPSGLVHTSNDWFYGNLGLQAAWTALKPGGVLGVWSAVSDSKFTQRLKGEGFKVEEHRIRSRPNNKGGHHHIWLAEKILGNS